jgi:hypothetical protein
MDVTKNVGSLSIIESLNPLNTELNPICHLLALLGGATIVVVSRLRANKSIMVDIWKHQYVNVTVAALSNWPNKKPRLTPRRWVTKF